jgi:hypothetical protein
MGSDGVDLEMKILVFAAYKVNKQGISAQGSCGFDIDIAHPSEFAEALAEAENRIKTRTKSDSVTFLNLTMQEWKEP